MTETPADPIPCTECGDSPYTGLPRTLTSNPDGLCARHRPAQEPPAVGITHTGFECGPL